MHGLSNRYTRNLEPLYTYVLYTGVLNYITANLQTLVTNGTFERHRIVHMVRKKSKVPVNQQVKNSLPIWRSAESGTGDMMFNKLRPIETGYIVSLPHPHMTTRKRMTTTSLGTNRAKLDTVAHAAVRFEKFSSALTLYSCPSLRNSQHDMWLLREYIYFVLLSSSNRKYELLPIV